MEGSRHNDRVTFRYHPMFRWLFAGMALAGLGFSGLLIYALFPALPADTWLLLALFLATGGYGLWAWVQSMGYVTADAWGVTVSRLGRSSRLGYDEVVRLQHYWLVNALVIHGRSMRLRIEKELKDYYVFYRVLSDGVAAHSPSRPSALPLVVSWRWWVPLVGTLLTGFGLLFFSQAVRTAPVPGEHGALAMLYLVALSCVAGGMAVLLCTPVRYVFAPDQVAVLYLTKRRVYPVTGLREMRLVVASDREGPDHIRLVFDRGQIWVWGATINQPLEVLAGILEAHYGIAEGRKANEGRLLSRFMHRRVYAVLTAETLSAIPDEQVEQAILDYIGLKMGDGRENPIEFVARMPVSFQMVYSTMILEAEFWRGGFNRFFFLYPGSVFHGMVLRSLDLLGAAEHYAIVQKAIRMHAQEATQPVLKKLYAQGGSRALRESYRYTALRECDAEFVALDDRLGELRIRFIREHPQLFAGA